MVGNVFIKFIVLIIKQFVIAAQETVYQLAHRPKKVTGSGVSVYKVTLTHIKGAAKHTYKVRLFRP